VLKKLSKIAGVLALVAFLVITLAFTSIKYRGASTCSDIQIDYAPDDKIALDKDVIRKIILNADKTIIGKKFDSINTAALELEVEKHAAVLNTEIFEMVAKDSTAYKGVLTVRVKHREPLLRVITGSGSYYLDEQGYKFPVSSSYPVQVLVANGNITKKFAREELLPCVRFIESDEFWRAQIEQIYVESVDNVILTPLFGEQLIEMGSLENYQVKLRNMKTFYKKVMANNNWNKYKTISLKYRDQIVAKRK
jgi:cell division protein FtsQ